MPTFKLTIAYDGTEYVGWQRQASGVSIQGLLEDALGELDGQAVPVLGAGRTDAGVHARGQVAGVTIRRVLTPASLARAINARLPPAVRVVDAAEAPPTFHARFDAKSKLYRYRIWNREVLSPFDRRYAWHLGAPALDVEAMRAAAAILEGRHDFSAFQASGASATTTTRTIFRSRLETDSRGFIRYDVAGDGFLRHMVRTITGTLVEVGRGRRGVDWMAEVLASRDRARAGPTAPAEGLFLLKVEYDTVLVQ